LPKNIPRSSLIWLKRLPHGGRSRKEKSLLNTNDLPIPLVIGRKIADLLRKHGGKTGEELKAEGK